VILDTSAVVAIIREEQGEARLVKAIEGTVTVGIGTPRPVKYFLRSARR